MTPTDELIAKRQIIQAERATGMMARDEEDIRETRGVLIKLNVALTSMAVCTAPQATSFLVWIKGILKA